MAEIAFSAISLALTINDKLVKLQACNQSSATIPVDVDQAKNWLTEMQASLRDAENIDTGSNLLEVCISHVEDTAYDIEDALAEYLLHLPAKRGFSQRMRDLVPLIPGNEVKNAASKLVSNMKRIENKMESYKKLEALLRNSSSSTRKEDWPEHTYLAEGDDIVGFETRNEELFSQLTGTDNLVILIAGPGGSGKSTMIKDIYMSERISKEGFGCHAWVHVPDMKLEKALLKILIQTESRKHAKEGKDKKYEEDDTREKLRLLLQQKKFLLVLDNVWSKNDLNIIKTLSPKGLPGSKIIITTRQSDVTSDPSYIHDLSCGLSSDRAKNLFYRKAFQNCHQNWPSILESWATRILNMCDGMPLAISAIGTLLANKPQVPADWKTVHDTLGSQICEVHSDLHVLFRSLQPSYRELPSNFKTCFLYFSMFPHDHSAVSQKRLIRLWVAEGFVMSNGRQLAEEMAADILDKLIKRNLVVARTMEVGGRLVRRYRVLHLVREINILRRKNFLTVLEPNCNPSGDSIRRLSVNNGPVRLIERRTSKTRTLLVFGLASKSPISDLEMILKTCKFLRVLDLQGLPALEKFPDHVVGLTLLKYLSLKGTQIKKVPKSIKKLVDLETLDLRQTNVTCLPNEICYLEKLRHLLVFCKAERSSGGVDVDLSSDNLGSLCSLQTLSCIKVENNRGILTALGELTGLRKLGLTDLQNEDGGKLCSSLEKMAVLSTLDVRATSKDMYLDLHHMTSPLEAPIYLQHLRLEGRLARVPQWIPDLTSLKKIGLKWSKLTPVSPVNPLQPLQGLPTLMELDLVDYCSGDQLVFEANTFEKLIILRMEQFDQLKSVKIEDRAMPQLKQLTMRNCKNLKVLPDGIEGLNLLDAIRCDDMHKEFIARLQSHSQQFQRIRIIYS